MDNREEGIKNYNDLLIKYLNDLVNSIEDDTEFKKRTFQDIIEQLKEQLSSLNVNFSNEMMKTILSQAFKEYSTILKNYFDHSDVHRIDINHKQNDNLTDEMNDMTSILNDAINNMNKTEEYANLIRKIKKSIVYHFQQVCPNYESNGFEIDQALNDIVVENINAFIEGKKASFAKDTLPNLYKICDELNHEITVERIAKDPDINVNEERDNFINETMDIEIHEGFENGVVTLTIIDQMGTENKYYGNEAMEKLSSYNQLYESSRPGKKADTSRWPKDFDINKSYEKDRNKGISNLNNNNININDNDTNNDATDNNNEKTVENNNIESNQISINDFIAKQNKDNNIINESHEKSIQIDETDFNNLTAPIIDDSSNIELNNNLINNTEFLTNNSNNNNENIYNNIDENEDSSKLINDFLEKQNSLKSDYNNSVIDQASDSQTDNSYTNNNITRNEFTFLPNYNNINTERNEFIKNSTGIILEEDKDNRNNLYLKVTEPSGREVVYTGKEAVTMIKNYNKAFLDANPGKSVDTTLIDNFVEN